MSQGSCGVPHGIECPQCSRHTVISINQNLWKCLNCDFSKDFSKDDDDDEEEADKTGVFVTVGGSILAALCLLSL